MTVGRRQSFIKRLESWAFHAYWNHISGMSLDDASNAGSGFARRLGPLTGAHKTARYNMRLAFPKITPAEEREMLDAMWDNLGRVLGEFPRLSDMALFAPESRVKIDGLEVLDRYLGTGQAGVFISGHFANWEVMPRCHRAGVGLIAGIAEPFAPHEPPPASRFRGVLDFARRIRCRRAWSAAVGELGSMGHSGARRLGSRFWSPPVGGALAEWARSVGRGVGHSHMTTFKRRFEGASR
ncbi:MAG: hypothetical protein HC777_00955 [Hyphomonadaceae bacterium]|nr:hypothetical protein [Hyphomonadaceae bacterium]